MSTSYPIADLPTPAPDYDPARVIEIQVSAFADNDDPVKNAGIKTAYNFASPANRRATGPLDRFIRMVEGPQYAPMIDHTEAVTGPIEREDGQASQQITLTGPNGQTATYEFGLSVHDGTGDIPAGCWLTDRVLRT